MKKILISFLLMTVIITSLLTINVSAALPPVVYGDLNYDYEAGIIDVTLIQRGLLGITEFGYETQLRADFDHDGEASIIDATWIQRKDVGMTIPESFGGMADQNILVTSFYADYDSGKAAVGVPITFTARANCGEENCTFEFFINGELVQERSEKNTLTHAFADSGKYDIAVRAYNSYGFRTLKHIWDFYYDYPYEQTYAVADSYPSEKLQLTAVNWIDYMYSTAPSIEVHTTGGTKPYTYCYTILDAVIGDQYTEEFYERYGWDLLYDDYHRPYLYRECSTNTLSLPYEMFEPRASHDILVWVKDASSSPTQTKTLYFCADELLG